MRRFENDRSEPAGEPNGERTCATLRESSEPRFACRESFPAIEALRDLETIGADPTAAATVLARFTVLQLFLQAAAGATSGDELTEDREIALSYLGDDVRFRAGEREALLTILQLAGSDLVQPLIGALLAAGTAAEGWRHLAGGHVYYRSAYHLASDNDLPAECAAAARGLAACSSDARSARLWRRRAAVWQRRSAQYG